MEVSFEFSFDHSSFERDIFDIKCSFLIRYLFVYFLSFTLIFDVIQFIHLLGAKQVDIV